MSAPKLEDRVALVCPGRGSYTEATMGKLPGDHALVRRAEELRAKLGLAPLLELDRAARFSASRHLSPANASPLIFLHTMLDAERVASSHRPVVATGNSMGWYSALAVAGALEFDAAFELVQSMALLQEQAVRETKGGQVLYPLVDDDWHPDRARIRAVEGLLADHTPASGSDGTLYTSIHLGGYVVLAGDEAGIAAALAKLPPHKTERASFPFRLALHGPYHTPLCDPVVERARERWLDLPWQRPRIPLVDGRGHVFSPASTDLRALAEYTLGHQVRETYDYTSAIRSVLHEFAPAHLALLGPGVSLAGPTGQIYVQERWNGIASKADLDARREAGTSPLLTP